MRRVALAGLVGVMVAFVAVGLREHPQAADAPAGRVDFSREVRPILMGRCVKCHGADQAESGLRLDQLEFATRKLESGRFGVLPGKSSESEIIRRITETDTDLRMPPDGPRLPEAEVQTLKRWIEQGAKWPSHWAYEPIQQVAIPEMLSQQVHLSEPIDVFIELERRKAGLQGAPRADKRTLIRRVYFDLLGLSPSSEEVAEFLADESPDAYVRLVDRLLASPHYGERWARYWMDVVHFAETHGHDQDRPRDHAWPYRDYLIGAFNDDTPYGHFIREQLAGDVIAPTDPRSIAATGFLSAGPWDESSLRDIRDDTLDREIARYLDRDDIVTTVMQTFVSTTVQCARCHDHKFDPVKQSDYYALQAVFAGCDKGNRKYDPDPRLATRRRELLAEQQQIPQWFAQKADRLLDSKLQDEVAAWEQQQLKASASWKVPEILALQSSGGATLTKQSDGSVYSEGMRPEKDIVTLTLRSPVSRVTGLRLDVLSDDRLPHKGPGRQDNGNLHLNEVVVMVQDEETSKPERRVELMNPKADFDQAGWSIDRALDGNPGTAWGIYPEVGKSHRAVFHFKQPVELAAGARLKVELHQVHGAGHLIGRARVSVSDTVGSLSLDVVPSHIEQIVATPSSQRSDDQRRELAALYLQQRCAHQLAELPAQQMVYCGGSQFEADGSFRPAATPRMVKLLHRGDITQPRDVVPPAALQMVKSFAGVLPATRLEGDADRRAALGEWLSDSRNSLTWRSIVNRIWQQHFGRGIVDSPNDFGGMGSAPTHPELLDWLATRLLAHEGSLKALHREMVTSDTYCQSSAHRDDAARLDADNRLLWRMNRRRLDAESIRDALLRTSGTLDLRMGGASDRQFVLSPGIHVTPNVDYVSFDVNHPSNFRRSVYRFLFRTLPDPFMETLDCPDGSQLIPVRGESMTALQALATLNDKSLIRLCQLLAERASRESAKASPDHVFALYRRILLREPNAEEHSAFKQYVAKHGMANACRWLVNSNEFMFVD